MRVERLVWSSWLCVSLCLSQLSHGSAGRSPLSPKEATQAMLKLMPNEKGFLTKLRNLVRAGADVNAQNRHGVSILHRVALFGGSSTAAKFIMDSTDDVPIPATFRETPLFFAIYGDNVEVARVLMEGRDPNFYDENEMTPLLYALEHKAHGVSKFLINKGADLDVSDKMGRKPLHLAQDSSVARLILAKGGDPDAQDNMGMTPLHYAADFDNRPVAKLLASASKDINIKGGDDEITPLYFVRSSEMAEIILKEGGDPNARTTSGQTPLHWVKDIRSIRIFAMYGADLNAEDGYQRTPMDYAATKEFLRALLLFGANPEKSYSYRQNNDNNKSSGGDTDKNTNNDNKGNNRKEHPTTKLYRDTERSRSEEAQDSNQPDFLTNLTTLARTKDSNPIIGREQEIAQVSNALRRKGMRGTVLVGDAGVGKTALIEGLAYLLAKGELPELAGREIYALNVGSMWGHSDNRYVGQLQKRVNEALEFIAAEPDKRILFIDEIHQLLGGGQVSTSGSPPITDILKSHLGRGDIQLIGATTHDEYQRIVEGDRAIVDRLLRIDIDEPSAEETLTILRGIKAGYEQHHGITVNDTALKAAVNLSRRYLAAQQQPRNAINLLDEAAAAMPYDAKRLTKRHIANIVAEKVGIQVATILKSRNEKAEELLPALQKEIYGQDHALEEIDSSLSIAFADLSDNTRPLATLLFAGTTGVGKTETAKVIAQHLFDSKDNLTAVDMSGYKHPTSVIGLTEVLTRAVKAKPYSVILLDEIEKAHTEVRHLLLQLLDEGRLTDSRQRKVDFTNTIIILTTNSTKIDKDFAPELLNRFNKTITFHKLSTDVSIRLVQKQLDALNHELGERKITVSLSDAAEQIVAEIGYHPEYGAREMARVFSQLVTYPLSRMINRGLVENGKDYHIDLQRTGSKKVKAILTLDNEVLLEVPISTKTLGKKNKNSRGVI